MPLTQHSKQYFKFSEDLREHVFLGLGTYIPMPVCLFDWKLTCSLTRKRGINSVTFFSRESLQSLLQKFPGEPLILYPVLFLFCFQYLIRKHEICPLYKFLSAQQLLYKGSKIVKLQKQKRKWWFPGEGAYGEVFFNGYQVIVIQYENVLEICYITQCLYLTIKDIFLSEKRPGGDFHVDYVAFI